MSEILVAAQCVIVATAAVYITAMLWHERSATRKAKQERSNQQNL
jgi:type II secretory pathway component PulK